jgi:hypothetical protein
MSEHLDQATSRDPSRGRPGATLAVVGTPPRRIRIPLVLDVVLVDQLRQIGEIDASPHLSRAVHQGGPLVNRLLSRRVARAFKVGPAPLPTFTERADAKRAAQQQATEARLARAAAGPPMPASDLTMLSDYVNGRGDVVDVGIVVQGVLGRLFDAGYRATRDTYEASRLVPQFPRAMPHRAWWWRLSGKLARSQKLLAAAAKDDPVAIHATTNTVHNVVETLTRMRAFAAEGNARVPAPVAVARCLAAPPALLRWCTAEMRVPGLARPIRPGTLVVLRLGRAHDVLHDAESPFLVGAWNQCPAHRYVTALLEAVWTDASRRADSPS